MKFIRMLLLVFGCLFIASGVLLLIYDQITERSEFAVSDDACKTADKESEKLEQLARQHGAASAVGDRIRLEFESKIQTERTERWLRNCSEERSRGLLKKIFFSGVAVGGLLLASAWFVITLLERRNRRHHLV